MTAALFHFSAACAGSLAVAFLLDLLLRRTAARWPALAAHRSVWLSAQLTVVLAFALACLPLPPSPVAPTLSLEKTSAASAAPAAGDGAEHADFAPHEPFSVSWLPAAWSAIYLAGLAWQGTRRLRAQRRWNQLLLAHSRIVGDDELGTLAGPVHGLTVRATGLPVSPMLLGVLRPCLLLPEHLSTLDDIQQRLIIAHELTHRQRSDPLWLMLSGVLSIVFWFNRPFQRLDLSLREAVELGCDDTVLANSNAGERRAYAAALVAQLRMQLQPHADGAPAFGNLGVAGRVQRMQSARPPRLSAPARLCIGAAMLCVAAASAALQPALSSAVPPPAVMADAPAALAAWRYPLDQVRVTSLYGVRSALVPAGHHGVDFTARRGTPVYAVAAGTVTHTDFDASRGHFVRVDHGGSVSSQVIHLDRIAVSPGQRVAAGQQLGTAGDSGKATGPHLHLEYWRGQRRLDPQIMLTDLASHATPSALARRRAQGNPVPTDQ